MSIVLFIYFIYSLWKLRNLIKRQSSSIHALTIRTEDTTRVSRPAASITYKSLWFTICSLTFTTGCLILSILKSLGKIIGQDPLTTILYALAPGSALVTYMSSFLLNLLEGFMTTSLRYQSAGYKNAWKRSRLVCMFFITSGTLCYLLVLVTCFTNQDDRDTQLLILKIHFCGAAVLLCCAGALNNFHCKLLNRRFNKALQNPTFKKRQSCAQTPSKDSSAHRTDVLTQERNLNVVNMQEDRIDSSRIRTASSLKKTGQETTQKGDRLGSVIVSTDSNTQR